MYVIFKLHNPIIYVGIAAISSFIGTIVRERNTTAITCEAFGYPPPTIVWSRLDGNLSDRVLVRDSVSVPAGYGNVTRVSVNLTITNVSREDTGVYMCSANNSIGNDSKIINITIQCEFIIHIILFFMYIIQAEVFSGAYI